MPSFLSSIGQKISDFFKPKEPETTPVNQSKLNINTFKCCRY